MGLIGAVEAGKAGASCPRPPGRLLTLLGLLAGLGLPGSMPLANTPQVSILPERELSFGTFMVFGSGSRTVSATGALSDVGIIALEGRPTGPARFTISYDRGNQSRNAMELELEVVISVPPQARMGGVEARLSAFETDLPGAMRITPGRPFRLIISDCRTRICSRTFQVGGRLDVTRHFGGAQLVLPIPVDVSVIAIDRRGA
ncbi:DUF4402 domain-containing protein [Alteraurantiacibacter palmitatis]|uniref:DUF4402 domain-containing protein n=1 Tax=Alteraurantiacibacter palmitatis TaxID=2054628 RepID=A0ABV7E897_9SPHN